MESEKDSFKKCVVHRLFLFIGTDSTFVGLEHQCVAVRNFLLSGDGVCPSCRNRAKQSALWVDYGGVSDRSISDPSVDRCVTSQRRNLVYVLDYRNVSGYPNPAYYSSYKDFFEKWKWEIQIKKHFLSKVLFWCSIGDSNSGHLD